MTNRKHHFYILHSIFCGFAVLWAGTFILPFKQTTMSIMKKLSKLILFSAVLFGASTASAQIYVTVRPAVPVVVMTDRPGPTHVWIDEEWVEEGGRYKYVGGYWVNPPTAGYKWKKGHWNHSKKHGNQWIRWSWYGKGRKR